MCHRRTTFLTLCTEAPKATRQGHLIIKRLKIHSLAASDPLCSMTAFLAVKNHLGAAHRHTDNLLVNSVNPTKPITVETISSWIRRLTKMSTGLAPVPSVLPLLPILLCLVVLRRRMLLHWATGRLIRSSRIITDVQATENQHVCGYSTQ
jgi:hypothetical protein